MFKILIILYLLGEYKNTDSYNSCCDSIYIKSIVLGANTKYTKYPNTLIDMRFKRSKSIIKFRVIKKKLEKGVKHDRNK